MKDNGLETGKAQAESKAAGQKGQMNHVTTRVVIDHELARAFGHDRVQWNAAQRPYVSTEPMPQSRD